MRSFFERLGGAPGRYIFLVIVWTVVAFPFHYFWFDRGDRVIDILGETVMQGVLYSLSPDSPT